MSLLIVLLWLTALVLHISGKQTSDQIVLFLVLNGVAPFLAEVVGPELSVKAMTREDLSVLTKILRKTSRSLNRFSAIEDSLDRIGPSMSQKLGLERSLIHTLTYIKAAVERDLRYRASQETLPYWITRRIVFKITEALGYRIAAIKSMPLTTEDLLLENDAGDAFMMRHSLRGKR